MTVIEPGLSVRDGFTEGPLADAALSRAGRTAQLFDELQEQAPTMTDGQLRDGLHRALRHLTQRQPPACQADSITALIRRGCASAGTFPTVCPASDARLAGEPPPCPPAGRERPN